MNKILLTLVFLVLLASITHATSNTIVNNTNLIVEGLPYGIGLNLTLLSGWYTINGTTGTTNYNIHFITQNGNTIVTIPSYIKPTYGSNLYFDSASLLSQVVLSGQIWMYNLSATSPSVASGQLVYGQNNILVFYSPFNLTSFYSNETKQLESLGISANSSIITTLNNLATNNTINLNNILTANQIKSIISSNTFGTNLNTSLIVYRNVSKIISYGHIKLSGNYLPANKAVNFSVFNSSQRTLYIIKANITKAPPQLCVDTNLGNVCTTTNQTKPVPLGVPVINGHFGLTQNNWYPLNVSFKSSLLANNTASWNVTIKDITNGTVLFNQIINSKDVNITKNYKIPVTQQVEMTIKTSGNQNYTSLIEDPITAPTGIQYYVAVNITNNQTTAIISPFQQMINITESSFGNYIVYNNNFANFEYFYANGTMIPAWIESNSSGKLITWAKLTPIILPNGKLTIYLGFANKTTNLLSSSGTTGIGEAPQLSSTYAQYDDGASVFNNYWNFAGTSLPNGFTSVVGKYGSVTVNNGLNISLSSPAWGTYVISSSTYASGNILDAYFESSEPSTDKGSSGATLVWTGSSPGVTASYGIGWQSPTSTSVEQLETVTNYEQGGATFPFSYVGTTETFNNNMNVMSLYINSTGDLGNSWYNYISLSASSTAQPIPNGYIMLQTTRRSQFVQWLRTRAYPNGTMPSVSFGSVQQTYTPLTVSLSVNTTTLNYGQTFKLIGNVTGGTAPYTYQWALNNSGTYQNITSATSNTYIPSILGAGTYKFNLYVKDSHPTLVLSAPITITINKIPIPSATFSTNTFTYNGVIPTITFTFNTINNQIPPAVVSLPSASAGTYTVSNTAGNSNYTSTTFSINAIINKASPLLSLNLPANFTYNGTAVSIPFSINTINNQVIANVLLNGALVKSTSTSNSISLASAGVYNITFTTAGNANYTTNSITKFFKINKATVNNQFIEASLQNGQLYQINGTGLMNITSTGSITISVQLKTINSQLPASLYLVKLINGKKAFLNGTLINASNEALLKPNITTKYFAQETFYLPKGIYEFEFNSTGNQNYTGFDPAFIVNQTENSQAPSSTGGGGGGGVVIINNAPTTTTIPPANSTLSITPVTQTPQLPFFSFNLGANIVSESILQMIYLPSISFVIHSYKITIPIWVIASLILAGSALYEYKHRKTENGHYLMIAVLVLVFFWLVFLSIG